MDPCSSNPCCLNGFQTGSPVLVKVPFPSVVRSLHTWEAVAPCLTILEPRGQQILLKMVNSEELGEQNHPWLVTWVSVTG